MVVVEQVVKLGRFHNAVLWVFPKANPASAAMTAEARVNVTAATEAARKNFNMQHTFMRRHQQTKLSYFIIVRLLLSPTRVFVWSPQLRYRMTTFATR